MSSPDQPVGIIYPPPDLRGIVDSTAKYVAKNGGAFEERIMREHRDKPKFKFLFPEDPFHSYYKHKVNEIKNSLISELKSKQPAQHDQQQNSTQQQPPPPQQQQQQQQQQSTNSNGNHSDLSKVERDDRQKSVGNDEDGNNLTPAYHEEDATRLKQDQDELDQNESNEQIENGPRVRPKLNEYIQEMTMKLVEPQPLNHLATSAPSLTRLDCDIMKLTAQYVATHGRSFLLELVSREHNNSEFDFLKPQHGQFSYMTNLIMQYAIIQNPPLDVLEQLGKDSSSRKHVLDRIRMRAEWNKMLEVEKKKKEEAEEKEKVLYSQIDWHDFVVVETIDYRTDEIGKYPPTTRDQVGTRLLIQQRTEDQRVPEEMEIDMDMDTGSGDEENDQEFGDSGKNNDNFAIPAPPDASKVIIRKDYDPKLASRDVSQTDNYFVSPITNERIPVDKIHEHVRYNLADPRYLEKKGQMLQERMNEEAVFASGSQIQDSLKNLAERRTDIFGMNDEETGIGQRIGEEEQEKPKDDKLIWDGHKSSLKKKKLN